MEAITVNQAASKPKTRSLAIIGAPLSLGQTRPGVSLAPAALREAGLHAAIDRLDYWDIVSDSDVELPDESFLKIQSRLKNGAAVGEATRRIAVCTAEAAAAGHFCLTLGGDHSIGLGSITGVLRGRPDTCVVWVDAHADINTPETSPSGNLHGMPLAAVLGYFKEANLPEFSWLDTFLPPERLAYIGIRSLDAHERRIIRQMGIKAFTMSDIDRHGIGRVMEMAMAAVNPTGQLWYHLSYDIDAVDPSVAPGTGTTERGGLTYREAHYIAETLAESGRLGSMDLAEINPELDVIEADTNTGQTVRLGVELIASALGQSIL